MPDGSVVDLAGGPTGYGANERGADGQQSARLVYAAAHLVLNESYRGVPHSAAEPGTSEEIAEHIDWDSTMRFREHLIGHGFGIAEAMDTAQRYEIGWPIARELIERCGRLKPPMGFVAGAGTDQFATIESARDIVEAMAEQCAVIREAGGWPMLLAQPWLSVNGCSEDEYVEVYSRVIAQAEGPLFIHWLGPMFLPALEGYFPGESFERIMACDPENVRGCKLSMLDAGLERRLRVKLAERGQIMLTGDDFHFGELMKGEPSGQTTIDGREAAVGDLSHGLLGVFDGIARPASVALRALGRGDTTAYDKIMSACEAFGRVVFEAPTQHYKTGLAFLAYLNGHQPNAMLVNHAERQRDVGHLCRVVCAAAACGAIEKPTLARERLAAWADSQD